MTPQSIGEDTRVRLLRQLVLEEMARAPTEERRRELTELNAFLGRVGALPQIESKLQDLEKRLGPLGEPPLQFGVYLGRGPQRETADTDLQRALLQKLLDKMEREVAGDDAEKEGVDLLRAAVDQILSPEGAGRDVVVGVQGQRFEARLAVPATASAQLSEGQEVVLNKMMNVVGIRDEHRRGDTAEVVNVLSPPGTARVLSLPVEGPMVQLQKSGGEKLEGRCESHLIRDLHIGDVVRIAEESDPVRIVERLRPRLHIRSGGSDGMVVEVSDRLFQEGAAIGDIVRADLQLRFAYEKLPAYETGGLALEEVPDVSYADIGGLDRAIGEIREAIDLPYLQRALFLQYQLPRPKGILLYGPPGCGKTMIAKAIANSLTKEIRLRFVQVESLLKQYLDSRRRKGDIAAIERHLRAQEISVENAEWEYERIRELLGRQDGIRSFFLNVKGPELLNKYVGETEHRIRKVFGEAKQKASFCTPVVIFFDEMESMFRARGSGLSSDVETTIVPQFLAEMDGVEASENVIIIGASNRPELIDPAIMRPGRLDVKIKIDRPDREAAAHILALNLTPDLPCQTTQQPSTVKARTTTFSRGVVERTVKEMGARVPLEWRDALLAAIKTGDTRTALETGELPTVHPLGAEFQQFATDVANKEAQMDSLISATLDLLYNPMSRLEAVTSLGRRHFYQIRDFVSGAVLVSIVSRAKRAVVKRVASKKDAASEAASDGLALEDVRTAVKEEFTANADTLVASRLDPELMKKVQGVPEETIQDVQVSLAGEDRNPWSVEKPRPYLELVALARDTEEPSPSGPQARGRQSAHPVILEPERTGSRR